MVAVESFTTQGLAPRDKVEAWNAHTGETFSPLHSRPADAGGFEASIARATIGDLTVVDVRSDPQFVQHSHAHVARTTSRLAFFQLQLEGTSIHRQQGHEASLSPGDFTFVENHQPYEIRFPTANRVLAIVVPHERLRRYVDRCERLAAVPVRPSAPAARLLTGFLGSYWNACVTGLDAAGAERSAKVLLDLLAATYAAMAATPCDEAPRSARRGLVLSFIEQHLRERALGPAMIAAALGMSRRRLHQIFAQDDETLCRYILRRRLDACAHTLESGSWTGRGISQIAFDHGFDSAAHFGRAFRERFGMAPSEFRRRKGLAGADLRPASPIR